MAKRTPDTPRYFPETQWSLVGRAGCADEAGQREALVELLKRYMPALQSFLVWRKRIDSHKAEDYLQGFLLSKIVESGLISGASKERGKFRSYLLASLNQYVMQQIRHEQALKRGAASSVGLEEDMDAAAPEAEPGDSFDVAWARELLSQAIRKMHNECIAGRRKDVWQLFEAKVIDPVLHGREPLPYEELVKRFGLVSPAQASNLLVTGRRTFVRVLRSLIAEYEPDPDRIDAEVNDLQTILSRAHMTEPEQ